MALKKLPTDMSYAAIRHKHPPTPNHKAGPVTVEKASADVAVQPSGLAPEIQTIAPPVDVSSGVPLQTEKEQDRAPGKDPREAADPVEPVQSDSSVSAKTVRVRGYVHVPAVGEHGNFDELREIYGEKDALAFALSNGMAYYETALLNAAALRPAPRSARRKDRVEASRTIQADLYAKAVAHLDPKEMLGKSQTGSRILSAALAYYLDEA